VPADTRPFLVRQFGRPQGLVGAMAGFVMATRRWNRQRIRRTVELLEIEPGQRVLEVGFGPGLGLAWAGENIGPGLVVGLDHSLVMLRQAARRNAAAIAAGRLELRLGSVENLADCAAFDRAFAVNVHAFWSPDRALPRLRAALKPGGRLALTYEPRGPGASEAKALAAAERLRGLLAAAGLVVEGSVTIPLGPVPAVCLMARRPLEGRDA
jgi:SAM-dependent methyltransferase